MCGRESRATVRPRRMRTRAAQLEAGASNDEDSILARAVARAVRAARVSKRDREIGECVSSHRILEFSDFVFFVGPTPRRQPDLVPLEFFQP